MGPFEVGKELVARLSDELLRGLLDRLLTAEARSRGISPSAVFVGGNQTAADGGVDASVGWSGPPEPEGWLPRRKVFFQCKAEVMAAAALGEEMRPRGGLRPIFGELVEARGAYVVFSTDDPSKLGYDRRLAAMTKAVSDLPGHDAIALNFYGADAIARWTNQHAGVALWLLERNGRSLGGWRPFGNWSVPDAASLSYLFDDDARAAVGESAVDMRAAVRAMRSALAVPGGVVRLVGMSGMGKTRLAEALFDPLIDAGPALDPASAIYGDAGLDLAVGASLLAEQVALAGTEAVIVVDNCNARTHGQLAETVKRTGSRSSLLTIDYDVGGEKPVGEVVSLAASSETLLANLLQQRFPKLSQAERRHLAEFSGGNARIALKVAEGSAGGVDLSTLDDGELIDRLFQSGRRGEDVSIRACAEAASLVYAFYTQDGDGHVIEHDVLAGIAGIERDRFYRSVAILLEWGVVQQRGPQRALMPPPLANMLAAPMVRRSDPADLLARFMSGPPRLMASFARRLGQLHGEPAAVGIALRLLADGGALGEPAGLNDVGRRAFLKIAPAAPEAALAAIARTLAGEGCEAFVAPDSAGRRDYAQLLVQIAHDPDLFERAMEALLVFALADGAAQGDQAAASYFLERFWPVLSFTLAREPARFAFVDRLLDDPSDAVRLLGVEALDHMLDAAHFSSSLNVDFGARPLLSEWRPNNGGGYAAWFGGAFARAARQASRGAPESERARAVVAHHLREHLVAGFADLPLAAMRTVRGTGYWDAGWRATVEGLHFGHNALLPATLVDVRLLERDLRPHSPEQLFDVLVLGEPWRHWHPNRGERRPLRNVGRLAEAVGRCLIRKSEDVLPFFRRAIAAGGQNSVGDFGVGLARATGSLDALWTSARGAFSSLPDAESGPDLLAGILKGSAARDRGWVEARLEEVARHAALGRHLVALNSSVALDAAAMDRFAVALAGGVVLPVRFATLMSGGVSKPVPAVALASFLATLFDHDAGVSPALQILHMRIFGDRSDGIDVDPALIEVGRSFLIDPRAYAEGNERDDYGIATIARFALRGDGGFEVALDVCRALRADKTGNRYSQRDFGRLCALLMEMHPRAVFDEIVGADARDDLMARFFGGFGRDDDDVDQAEIGFDEGVALEWMLKDAQARALRLTRVVPYTVTDADSGQLGWSPFVLRVLDLAPDPVPVLRTLERRFWSGSSSGSFSARFVRRRPLVAAMLAHADVGVRNWAREAARHLEDDIRRWDERDRVTDSRFE